MKKIKAVIFDMDGVLIDARDWHYDALNKALELFGMQISRHEHLCSFDGLPTKKKLEMLSIERGLPYKLHDFIHTLKQKYTLDIVHSQCKPTFYHQYALSQLKNAGYKLAVCSNSVRKTVEIMLEKAELTPYLEFYLSSQDVENTKPDPEIYNNAIARLGVQPDECLIVEDNINGIKAALASGSHLLRVNGVEDVNLPNILKSIKEAVNRMMEPAGASL